MRKMNHEWRKGYGKSIIEGYSKIPLLFQTNGVDSPQKGRRINDQYKYAQVTDIGGSTELIGDLLSSVRVGEVFFVRSSSSNPKIRSTITSTSKDIPWVLEGYPRC